MAAGAVVASLRHRDFRVLWTATFVSNAGSWMQKVATAWLIYERTGSTTWLGIDAFASGFTTVALLPLGGVVADRMDRRLLLIVTNVAAALLSFGLAALAATGSLHVWHIVAYSALSGVVQSVMVPAGASLLPSLVGADDVPNAVALNSLQFNVSRALGPVVGGWALSRLGPAPTFALNALSFLVLVGAFVLIRRVPPVPHGATSFARSLAQGLDFVRRRGDLIRALLLVAAVATLGAPVVSLLPALTVDVLARQAATYSFLMTCFGVGAIAGAVLATLVGQRLARPPAIAALVLVVGAAEVGLAFSNWTVATVLVGFAGFGFVGAMIELGTTILQGTDDAHRGRVTSLQQICFRIGQPLGALVGGLLADRIGVGAVFGLFGGLLVATALAALIPVDTPRRSEAA